MPPSEYQKLNGGRKEDAKILMSNSTPVDFLYEFEFTYLKGENVFKSCLNTFTTQTIMNTY